MLLVQEECARLQENVPYVKVHRYNPKHLYPKLNDYGDNGQRKVWSSCGSTYCTCSADALLVHCACPSLKVEWVNVAIALRTGVPSCKNAFCVFPRGILWHAFCLWISPDLTPLDYYLWGHMKTLVYETKVDTRAALRDRIFVAAEHTQQSSQHCFCYSVPVDACRKLHSNWRRTLWTITVKQVLYFSTVM